MALHNQADAAHKQLDNVSNTKDMPDKPSAGWGKAKAVLANVQVSQAFHTLRDMNTDTYIDPSCLSTVKVLGEGAYATVHQAWYTPKGSSDRQMVAVKYLKKELFRNKDDLELFVKEVELMKKLRHRNIVEFIGAGELSDSSASAYVVQEYMAGGTVKQLLICEMLGNGRRVYNDAQALDICLQIARGLKYLHMAQPMVIHRDLKLENVLVKGPKSHGKYDVKLIDFGLSRRVEVKQAEISSRRHESEKLHKQQQQGPSPQEELDAHWTERVKSQTSMARMPSRMFAARPKDTLPLHTAGSQTFDLTGRTGSLMYMAPEVFHEQPYNEKADVFSFGIMMYEIMHQYIMLMAVSVRGTYDELEAYCARVAGGYRPPLQDKWPEAVNSIIQDCWAQDPTSRPSMQEVVARLEDVQASGVLEHTAGQGCQCCIS